MNHWYNNLPAQEIDLLVLQATLHIRKVLISTILTESDLPWLCRLLLSCLLLPALFRLLKALHHQLPQLLLLRLPQTHGCLLEYQILKPQPSLSSCLSTLTTSARFAGITIHRKIV